MRGFSLITTLLVIVLIASQSLVLHFRVIRQWEMATRVESQLYSFVLAENGIEYARTLLPHLSLNSLLLGADGSPCGSRPGEWRNPMPFAESLGVNPLTWSSPCDDGLPAFDGKVLLPQGYQAEGNGHFFLRFSNNPEEAPEHDEDFIVLVRSLAIVTDPVRSPFLPSVKNSVALIEARFRQERSFFLPSPLTLMGNSGSFRWKGDQIDIEAPTGSGISLVSLSASSLHQNLMDSLSPGQLQSIRNQTSTPAIQDASLLYRNDLKYAPLFSSRFWSHFLDQLPKFTDLQAGGITFLPDGGRLSGPLSGMLIAKKDLDLAGDTRFKGLLLHLGEGKLTLSGGAQVVGGVWMSNLDSSGPELVSRPLSFEMSDKSAIHYSQSAMGEALALVPPTQLGWRILFPETVR
ncbi:MAG: hypothetical protein V3R94_02695 [Acidobacteriota bacterium]